MSDTEKNCATCIYFTGSESPHVCGKCNYPVPEWQIVHGCPYVHSHEGTNCAMHKTIQNVAAADLKSPISQGEVQ